MGKVIACIFAIGLTTANAIANEDWETGRKAAATLVAETLMTDRAYDAFVQNFATSSAFGQYATEASIEKAAEIDEEKAFDAFLSTARNMVPREKLVEALSTGVAERFNYDELKEIVRFVRSDVGRRYFEMSYDGHLIEAMEKTFGNSLTDDVLESELKKELAKRFPNLSFDF